MENTESQPTNISSIVPPAQPESNQTPPPPEEKSSPKWFIPFLILLLLTSLGIVGIFAYQNFKLKQEAPKELTPTPPLSIISPTLVIEQTTDWETYKIEAINLEFKLPPELGSLGRLEEKILPGEKGNLLCLTFPKKTLSLIKPVLAGGIYCDVVTFGFGTTSLDFEAGRMGGFIDLQGFEIIEGKYYARLLGKTFEIPNELVEEITNPYGIKILKIIGKNSTSGEWQGPIAGTPGDGWIGALINIENNPKYIGIAVQMKLENNFTEKLFEEILSTIKFLEPES